MKFLFADVPSKAWWEDFTPEERADLEAWLAEVNKFPHDREPEEAERDQAARLDPDAPF